MLLAVLCIILTYLPVLADRSIRDDARLKSAYLLTLTLHHIVAFVNAELMVLPGAEGDSEMFYEAAAATSGTYNYHRMLYTQFLRYLFGLFGSSRFLACELSVLAFAGCCLILIRLMDCVQRKDAAPMALLLFANLPSVLIHFSIPLRESFQSLALLCVALSACRLRKQVSATGIAGLVAGVLILGASHDRLSMMALGIILLSGLLIARRFASGFSLLVMFGFIPLFYGVSFDMNLESSASTGIASVREYREGVMNAGGRAMYAGQVETSSLFSFLLSVPRLFLLYMMAPFPWQISSPADILAFGENWLRIFFVLRAIGIWRRLDKGYPRDVREYLIVLFLFVELVWSLGTGNWGTAYRHHSVSILLLPVLSALPPLGQGEQGGQASPSSRGAPSLREQIRQRRRKMAAGQGQDGAG